MVPPDVLSPDPYQLPIRAKLDFFEKVGGFLASFFGVIDGDLGGFLGPLCDVLSYHNQSEIRDRSITRQGGEDRFSRVPGLE